MACRVCIHAASCASKGLLLVYCMHDERQAIYIEIFFETHLTPVTLPPLQPRWCDNRMSGTVCIDMKYIKLNNYV